MVTSQWMNFKLTDYSDHFKICTDDFFVIYAENIDRFLVYIKFVHDINGINVTHGKFEGDNGDFFPVIHLFLRKILSPVNIDLKQNELIPGAGIFKVYQVRIYPPNCHRDSEEDHDMCLLPNYEPALIANPDIIPHTDINANVARVEETIGLAHYYLSKLFMYINQHHYNIFYKFRVYLSIHYPDGAIAMRELFYDRHNQGAPDQ